MEDILIICIEDKEYKKVPMCTQAIRQQAYDFYSYLRKKYGASENETFNASRGWFDRFRVRYSSHNVKFTG